MNFKFTAILLVVLLALGGYVYLSESNGSLKADIGNPKEPQIFALDTEAINQMEIRKDAKQIILTKDNEGRWFVKEPEPGPADDSSVGLMASRLANLKAARLLVESADDLSPFGLDRPKTELTIRLQNGKSEVLYLGNENPNGTYHYARRPESSTVYLVYSSLGNDLNKWVSNPPKALPTPTPETTKIP